MASQMRFGRGDRADFCLRRLDYIPYYAGRRTSPRLANALLSIGFIVFTSAACAQQAAPQHSAQVEHSFPHAFARRGCTQEDAPALEIFLTRVPFSGIGDPPPSYVRVELSSSPTEKIESSSFTLIQMRRDPAKPGRVVRAELVEASHKSIWLSGTITLNEAVPGERVSGRYALSTPAGQLLDSTFIAEYSKKPTVCG
jgi:hypothetical protein